MNKSRYWEIIENANNKCGGDKKILISLLNSSFVNENEAEEFHNLTSEMIESNYENNNRLRNMLIKMSPNGYVSDNKFQYIIADIISRGKNVYTMITCNPKNLPEIDDNYYNWDFEEFMYVGLPLYKDEDKDEFKYQIRRSNYEKNI